MLCTIRRGMRIEWIGCGCCAGLLPHEKLWCCWIYASVSLEWTEGASLRSGTTTMEAEKSGISGAASIPDPAHTRQEVRCAVRFPLSLPVLLTANQGEFAALTRNVSASGVLFELDRPLQAGLDIGFSLRMPGTVLGTPRDVLVHCRGRVVRCSMSQTQYQAAATIDEYQFAEQ